MKVIKKLVDVNVVRNPLGCFMLSVMYDRVVSFLINPLDNFVVDYPLWKVDVLNPAIVTGLQHRTDE